ncbi:MAG: A/G-specific adenine glycosylase [Sphingomicrobium sp.]
MPANRLLEHYVDNARALPWRALPGAAAPDPYRVWLSEIMLQQTNVATVTPRFMRFVARWPTVADLAAADDADILGEWAGLGYYARARNLIACARAVAARGGFPTTEAELRALPGIGAYTAAAIAAIAFGEAAAAVDTNVMRVIARLHALATPSRAEVRALVEPMLGSAPGDVTQALMDLGATICRPRNPLCDRCPLAEPCLARASGTPAAFPVRTAKPPRPRRYGVAHWIERDGAVWLVRRPPSGLLGGMAALPGPAWSETPVAVAEAIGTVRHVFTHFALELAIVARAEPAGEGWWHRLDRLDQAGLPTLYRRAAAVADSAQFRPPSDA